jgi:hypothetical protein
MPTRAVSSRPDRAPRRTRQREAEQATEPETAVDREAAMNRLFAPLTETDSTEPLPARPKRSPSRSDSSEG